MDSSLFSKRQPLRVASNVFVACIVLMKLPLSACRITGDFDNAVTGIEINSPESVQKIGRAGKQRRCFYVNGPHEFLKTIVVGYGHSSLENQDIASLQLVTSWGRRCLFGYFAQKTEDKSMGHLSFDTLDAPDGQRITGVYIRANSENLLALGLVLAPVLQSTTHSFHCHPDLHSIYEEFVPDTDHRRTHVSVGTLTDLQRVDVLTNADDHCPGLRLVHGNGTIDLLGNAQDTRIKRVTNLDSNVDIKHLQITTEGDNIIDIEFMTSSSPDSVATDDPSVAILDTQDQKVLLLPVTILLIFKLTYPSPTGYRMAIQRYHERRRGVPNASSRKTETRE